MCTYILVQNGARNIMLHVFCVHIDIGYECIVCSCIVEMRYMDGWDTLHVSKTTYGLK